MTSITITAPLGSDSGNVPETLNGRTGKAVRFCPPTDRSAILDTNIATPDVYGVRDESVHVSGLPQTVPDQRLPFVNSLTSQDETPVSHGHVGTSSGPEASRHDTLTSAGLVARRWIRGAGPGTPTAWDEADHFIAQRADGLR